MLKKRLKSIICMMMCLMTLFLGASIGSARSPNNVTIQTGRFRYRIGSQVTRQYRQVIVTDLNNQTRLVLKLSGGKVMIQKQDKKKGSGYQTRQIRSYQALSDEKKYQLLGFDSAVKEKFNKKYWYQKGSIRGVLHYRVGFGNKYTKSHEQYDIHYEKLNSTWKAECNLYLKAIKDCNNYYAKALKGGLVLSADVIIALFVPSAATLALIIQRLFGISAAPAYYYARCVEEYKMAEKQFKRIKQKGKAYAV